LFISSIISLIPSWISFLLSFWYGVGLLVGLLFGRGIIIIINRVQLAYEGLYPALLFSLIFLTYSTAHACQGNGFLAVYVAGIISGNANLIHKKTLRSFMEGFAWLMQIAMFLTLRVFGFSIAHRARLGIGLLISLVLMFVARL